MRRAMIFRITPQALMSVVTVSEDKWTRCIEGVPEGGKLLGAQWNFEFQCFDVAVEHESFMEVAEGCILPIFMPRFTALVARNPISIACSCPGQTDNHEFMSEDGCYYGKNPRSSIGATFNEDRT